MTDIDRELVFYRSQCNDLGKRILELQKDNTRILRDHKRTRVLAKLIAEAHRQTSAGIKIEDIEKRFLQVLMGTLNVDCAAILEFVRDKSRFIVKERLGFGQNTPNLFRPQILPDEFVYVNSKTVSNAGIEALRKYVDVPFFLWSFNEESKLALILGNKSQDNNLHAPFEKKDREIVEGALNVFIDIFERKKAEETIIRRDSILEAVGFATEEFMRRPNWEGYTDQILEKLGLALAVCRGSLYRTQADQDGSIRFHRLSQWVNKNSLCQKGVSQKCDKPIPFSIMPDWKKELKLTKTIKGNLSDFVAHEKEVLSRLGIRSILVIPIFCGEEWWGMMTFCDFLKDHDWPITEIEAVKLAASNLGALIQRNRMDNFIKESEQKYRLIAENISDIVWTMDLNLQPTYVSPSVELILGLSVEEAMATSLKELLTPRSYRKTGAMFDKLCELEINQLEGTKWPLTMEIELLHKNGRPVTCEASNLPILDENDQLIGLIGVTRDIRERKRYEKKLIKSKEFAEKANSAKSDFLANMSHELRTPLNHIIGFTELIVDKIYGDLNERQEEYLKDVLTSGRHLLSLINDVLDLSKVESGKLELQEHEFKLKVLLNNSLIMIKEKALKNGIRLSTHIDNVPDTIVADERKLKQVLYNLLSNALKFTPKGGEICIDAKRVEIITPAVYSKNSESRQPITTDLDEMIQISISDTGIGLKSDDCERIFNPFEQVESSASRRFPGTGLGLSLTKTLVELHGGRVWVESDGEDKGSKFFINLPVRARG